jgi:hypothetical protein
LQTIWPGVSDVHAADLNGDGLVDLYAFQLGDTALYGKLHAFAGTAPEPWRALGKWQPRIGPDMPVDIFASVFVTPPLPAGDLDGDGVADILVFRPTTADNMDDSPLRAYSGKDGRRLWVASDLGGTLKHDRWVCWCTFLECRDLDGDGRPEILCKYVVGSLDSLTSQSGSPNQCWVAVLAGDTGRLLWKEHVAGFELSDRGGGTRSFKCSQPFALEPPGLFDVDGDGVLDVVMAVDTDSGKGLRAPESAVHHLFRARNGKTGALLWERPRDASQFLVGAVSSKDAREMLSTRRSPAGWDVVLADAATGNPKATWPGPKGYSLYDDRENAVKPLPILADLDGGGRRLLAMALRDQQSMRARLYVWEPDGKVRQTIDIAPLTHPKGEFRLWAHDVLGQGKEQLIFVSNAKVQVLGDKLDQPIWQWPLPEGAGRILGIQPAGKDRPAAVVVACGSTAYGLDGKSGKVRWRCEGVGRPMAVVAAPGGQAANGQGLPQILFHQPNLGATICRQAVPVDASGKYRTPAPKAVEYSTPPPDPYHTLPLPWLDDARERLPKAALPALACLVLLAYFAAKRRWLILAVLSAFLILLPPLVGWVDVARQHQYADQTRDWTGWYLIWPACLSAPLGWASFRSPLTWMVLFLLSRPILRHWPRSAQRI